YPLYSQDGTIEYLSALKKDGILDQFDLPAYHRTEIEGWNRWLDWLIDEKKIDLLWMVNSDEIITLNEIEKILNFVKKNELTDLFKINFKNYCIDFNTYVDNFCVDRIWWTNKNQGIFRFFQDDLVEYKNNAKAPQCSSLIIPKKLAMPKHYSWVSKDENKIKRKLKFQKIRYKICSFRWNNELGKLELNPEYYSRMSQNLPTLFQDI
ncbi:MAG: hypothetical protein AABY22_01350, partial [Nanoarchaeota archaeon]